MAIFDPSPDQRPKSARSSVDHDRTSHRMTVSRPPSIESINSANSVPFAPPPPPPPSAWKQFTNHFSTRVIKRHIKFLVAIYIASAMALIPQVANVLGPSPYLANVAVVFMHPARTVGSQLEVTLFSVLGAVLAAVWIIPCQLAVVAFNQRYLADGNNSAWAITAAWFFLGVWIMTTYKARYAKLNCTFIIYTIGGIFALTRNHASVHFDFNDFWYLMGPLMLGVGICLFVSALVWPETASEGLGRALNESLDTSRSLLNLSTRSFLLNHKTIALPKSAIDKAQAEVRMAQKKLFSAYREARYEVTYSLNNPADYKEVRVILSALMRHLGSMSLVVQNERLLMLGHPDRDDDDLLTQSGGESCYSSDDSDIDSDSEEQSESDNSHSDGKTENGSDYFGSAAVPGQGPSKDQQDGSSHDHHNRHHRSHHHHHHHKKSYLVESPTSDDEHITPHRRIQRRGSAAELRRIRQLLKRAENSTQAALKARQQTLERQKKQHKEQLQHAFQFGRGGVATAPSTPGGRGVFSVFGHHQIHRSRGSPLTRKGTLDERTETPSSRTSPYSSRANSIHEGHNLDTVKSFKSLFSVRSGSKTKPGHRPSSLKAGFKVGHKKNKKDSSVDSPSVEILPGIPLDDVHFATMPTHLDSDGQGTQLSERQLRKAAEVYRKKREKEAKRERKQAEKLTKAAQEAQEKQQQAEAAARAIPPKEVAFGDRKLFMSFLDIVRDPLQRLSDACSRVMESMERELVAGMDVEQDRLERLRRRDAQRTAAVKAAEARLAEEERSAANGTIPPVHSPRSPAEGESTAKCHDKLNVLDRLRVLVGAKPRLLTQEDMDYAEAIKSGMKKKGEATKSRLLADTIHPNKFLNTNKQKNTASSGNFDEDEFVLPVGMSYVQYLTQELNIFDEAEAKGLRDFIATHPTLDVGPREEIFLIFFFLFALREIARELLRLGNYIEELEVKSRTKLENEGRTKRRKQLWWPKVMGNFWHWFAWGNYTQVKTSEGHNAVILNTTKNLEHRQPRTIEEERAVVEAKAAKAAAEKVAAETAAKVAMEKKHRRRHSETWDLPPLRRSVTLSTMIHRDGQSPDLEQGLGGQHHHNQHQSKWTHGAMWHSRGRRSRSNSQGHLDVDWLGPHARRRRCNDALVEGLAQKTLSTNRLAEKKPAHPAIDLGDPSVLGAREILANDEESKDHHHRVAFKDSDTVQRYAVVEIPEFESMKHRDDQDLKSFKDINQVELSPRLNILKASSTAPPELSSARGSTPNGATIIAAPSSTHQDRYPSFTSSTSPALLDGRQRSDSTTVASTSRILEKTQSAHTTDSEGSGPQGADHSRRNSDDGKKAKSRSQSLFAAFSRHAHDSDSESFSEKKRNKRQAEPEAEPAPRTIFVNVRKPKTWRFRAWESLQPFKSEEFKFGFKMAVALTFIGLWSWLQWSSTALATDRGQWAMMTVMAVLSPTVGATFSVCAMRIGGTLAGTIWALLTFLALPRNPWVICAMMLIIAFLGIFLILETSHPKLGIIMLLSYSSITFIMYEAKTSETIYQVCYKRAITVIIGIIVSVIMNTFLWPILARRQLRKEIAILIGRQGVLFAEIVNKFLLEDPPEEKKHFVTNWPADAEDADEDFSSEEEDEKELEAKYAGKPDPLEHSFVECAEEQEQDERRTRRQRRRQQLTSDASESVMSKENDERAVDQSAELLHQTDDIRNQTDPDRLAFQHVEHQLQTKLIKILQLLELSGSEPRLKEEFPMKLYKQIIQCCQNILDRMVSMRMAAQLLSPEVRELVTGPMNYYRRDMVGALLLYFSVLSSSLASKSPLPPYLPSARMARLRVIYNVREAIAAHQAVTGEDHYTYIYYYAFSSALEEVIEELELLAILIKPLVGVTLVSSGDEYTYGIGQGNEQLHLPPNLCAGSGVDSATTQPGTLTSLPTESIATTTRVPHSHSSYEQHAGLGGSLVAGSMSSVPGLPSVMVNIGRSSTAGTGSGAFGSFSPGLGPGALQGGLDATGSTPQQRQYLHERLLQQQQAQRNRQVREDRSHQQQQQLSSQPESQDQIVVAAEESADNAPTDKEISLQEQLREMTAQKEKLERQIQEQHQQLLLLAKSDNTGGASSMPPKPHWAEAQGGSHTHHGKTAGLHIDIPSIAASSSLAVPDTTRHSTKGVNNSKVLHAARSPTSPILLMDEKMLLGGSGPGGRHSQRYKEAIETAQEASGQRLVVVPSSPRHGTIVAPGQIQIPIGGPTISSVPAGSNSGVGAQPPHKHYHRSHSHSRSHGQEEMTRGQIGSGVSPRSVDTSQFLENSNDNAGSGGGGGGGGGGSHGHNNIGNPHSNMTVPIAVVMPFGTDLVPQAPLPLHMIPTIAQQQQQGQQGHTPEQQQQP
ncbi:hypothetical protein BGZ83_009555 [Gryganskiella cystojenkinii]|nr:hypothetical protein BGZ83_009555 [Gryganskiella cystojenkinii]